MVNTEQGKILLINDSKTLSHDLNVVLQFLGAAVVSSGRTDWHQKVDSEFKSSNQVQMALIGQYRPDHLGKLLQELIEWHEGVPIVLIGQADAVQEPLRSRLTAVISLPLSYQSVLDALHKAQVYQEHYNRLRDIGGVRDYNMFRSLVGKSHEIQRIRQVMGQVANKEVTVLITGESGTGKEVVARNLHMNSARANKPFVPLNCGAIPPDLLESELFGHEKGAFTGAISTRIGRFELAEGGTLFLDEIGDMPLPMQVKLLRVLQEHCFERVGGTRTIQTDVRIFAATHKNLEDMIENGSFRQDLYYRINVFPIEMPALRERADDIPYLLHELISRMENEKRGSVRFNACAIESMKRHPWPGNVRELANLVERMAIMHPHGVVGVNDLPRKFRHLDESEIEDLVQADLLPEITAARSAASANAAANPVAKNNPARRKSDVIEQGPAQTLLPLSGIDLKEYLAKLECDLIEQALDDCGGVVARAAERLNIRRTTLVEKMRKYDMQKRDEE
ncbi:MAG: sigma-54 dependent transcriptional regulator [Pseudomonadales bacterium]|nr:sigma-54 dependent transcriptional regulator [Pseudomonadales bacterium]